MYSQAWVLCSKPGFCVAKPGFCVANCYAIPGKLYLERVSLVVSMFAYYVLCHSFFKVLVVSLSLSLSSLCVFVFVHVHTRSQVLLIRPMPFVTSSWACMTSPNRSRQRRRPSMKSVSQIVPPEAPGPKSGPAESTNIVSPPPPLHTHTHTHTHTHLGPWTLERTAMKATWCPTKGQQTTMTRKKSCVQLNPVVDGKQNFPTRGIQGAKSMGTTY